MKKQTVLNFLIAIQEKALTPQEVLLFLEQKQPNRRWNSRDQILLTRDQIRADWFSANLVNRSISINTPVWKHRKVTLRELITHRTRGNPRWSKSEKVYSTVVGVLRCVFHYCERLDHTWSEGSEHYLESPTMTNAELGRAKARITRERKKERKLAVAEAMAKQPNATTRAIERLAFISMYRDM